MTILVFSMLHRLAADPLEIKATRVDAIEGLVDLMDLANSYDLTSTIAWLNASGW